MGKPLDSVHQDEGPAVVISHLEKHGWTCEKREGLTICRKPGSGIELSLPGLDMRTSKVPLRSRIVVLMGE